MQTPPFWTKSDSAVSSAGVGADDIMDAKKTSMPLRYVASIVVAGDASDPPSAVISERRSVSVDEDERPSPVDSSREVSRLPQTLEAEA